jgi:hypothetical protein
VLGYGTGDQGSHEVSLEWSGFLGGRDCFECMRSWVVGGGNVRVVRG